MSFIVYNIVTITNYMNRSSVGEIDQCDRGASC